MKIVLLILAILMSIFLFGTNDKDERKAFTIAYVITIAGLVAIQVMEMVVAAWW